MDIYPCGTEILLARSDYLGVITCVSIRDTRIAYEVSYFEDGTYKANTFAEYEFSPVKKTKKQTIGFKTSGA